jgi:acyl-CoA synthetase (AMP-forming)/AMP-acid ligase II
MPTIASTLRLTAARVPSRRALTYASVEYTYAELDTAVDQMACALLELGVRKGDRLALLAGNSDQFVIAFYAAHRIGAIFVPINPTSAPPEIDHIVTDCDATILVFDPALVSTVRATQAVGRDDITAVSLGNAENFPNLVALASQMPRARLEHSVAESDDAQILYTSGTTGRPKGALFDHHRAMWVAVSCVGTCGMMDGDRFLHVAPLYHAAQLCMMLIPGTLLGATHVVHDRFDPACVLDALERERITVFFGVPTMYQLLLRQPDFVKRDLSSLRTALFGAAPMPASAVEALGIALPGVGLMQLCGQTEAGPSGIFSTPEQVRLRPDASGRQAVLNMECRVVDVNGHDVAPGECGELLLKGETIMKEYWRNREATAAAIVDGWLHTGDICRLDADGYLTLVDRLKDMIITGGRNVYSIEVEGAVAAHPAVVDVAVIGRPHRDYGESIVAVVTLAGDSTISLDELREFVATRLAHYKLPRELVIVPQLPRNASGKILKRQLREQICSA